MKIYRVSVYDYGEHRKYVYKSNMRDAVKARKEGNTDGSFEAFGVTWDELIEVKDVFLAKWSILDILNTWGSHPDNG